MLVLSNSECSGKLVVRVESLVTTMIVFSKRCVVLIIKYMAGELLC